MVSVFSADATAQGTAQFRSPEVPSLRAVGGQLISNPTSPQTKLQTVVQDNLLRPRGGPEFPEYQFGNSTASQFEELSNQVEQGTAVPFDGQMSSGQRLETMGQAIPEDPNFNGFTPKSFRSGSSAEFHEDNGSSDSHGFDSETPRNGISDFFKNRNESLSESQSEDSLEELPPAINEGSQTNRAGRTDQIIQRFPNGNKRIVRSVAQDEDGNFSNHGPWEAFDLKGNSVAAGVFERGVMQGQWRRQHNKTEGGLFATKPFNLYQGPYLSVANFKDGKLNRLWTIYDRYRSKIFEITYSNGVRNGTATWWYPNRAKVREATFKDGLLNGMILGWDDAEKLTRREEYINGRKIVRNVTFYRPKKPKQEEFYLDSKLEPAGEDSWWDAKPTSYLPRGSKVQSGGAAQWYENGQLKHQGQFKEGKPIGRFVWWHANGNKSIQGFHAAGEKTRTWTWWHENGMKKTEGTYQNDQPVGVWRAWYADGSLRNEETFSESDESETPNYEPQTQEMTSGPAAGQSVIEPESTELKDIEELPEELPKPIDKTLEQSPDATQPESTDEIEGHDFRNQTPDVGNESFRVPTDPRDIDPFGEIVPRSDGSISEEHFNQPESGLFRAPKENKDNHTPPNSKSQPVSDPFGDKLFQPPRLENLTTSNPRTQRRR